MKTHSLEQIYSFIPYYHYTQEQTHCQPLLNPLCKGGQNLSLPLVAESEVGKNENFGGFFSSIL